MTYGKTLLGLTVLALAATPLAPAHAEGWHHGGDGGGWHHGGGHYEGGGRHIGFGVLAGVAALTGAAFALATAPVRLAADAVSPPEPVYAAPQPQAYYGAPAYYNGYAPTYYPHRRVVVYSYPQPYPVATYAAAPYPYYPPQY